MKDNHGIWGVFSNYLSNNLSVIPVKSDKTPFIRWNKYQNNLPTKQEIKTWMEKFPSSYIGIICGRISGNLECIDIDIPDGLKRMMENATDEWKKIFSKCIIEKTPSGGHHIIYRCPKIEGSKKLAVTSKNEVIIETRGEGSYIVAYPSPNYKLVNKSFRDIPEITEEERNVLFTLASMLDQSNQAKETDKVNDRNYHAKNGGNGWIKYPSEDFNERCNFEELLKEHGWTFVRAKSDMSFWNSPNSRDGRGYGATLNYNGSGLFYVFTTNSVLKPCQAYTPFRFLLESKYNNDFERCIKDLIKQGYGVPDSSKHSSGRDQLVNFTKDDLASSSDERKYSKAIVANFFECFLENGNIIEVKIDLVKMCEFLSKAGFCYIYLDKNNTLQTMLVKINNNIVEETTTDYVVRYIVEYIQSLSNDELYDKDNNYFINKFLRARYSYVSEKIIFPLLPVFCAEFVRDTANESYYFFKNGFVKVTKESIELLPYSELRGLVWKNQIIQKDFSYLDYSSSSVFEKFIMRACTDSQTGMVDKQRFETIVHAIGYMLHTWRNPADAKAVVLSEENIDIETAKGGTGKGLIMKAIGYLRKMITIDAKNIDFNSQFALQNMSADTQLIFFDDVRRNFDFKNLFSLITEGVSYEQKNKPRVTLPFELSPKIVLSTNYALFENSVSARRRKYDVELKNYYGEYRKPDEEFGHTFFYEWDREEWNRFFNFMFNCVRRYFYNNKKIPQCSTNMDRKNLILLIGQEFFEYAEQLKLDEDLLASRIYDDFVTIYVGPNKNMTKIKFTSNLKKYCDFKNYELHIKRRHNGDRYYLLTKKKSSNCNIVEQKDSTNVVLLQDISNNIKAELDSNEQQQVAYLDKKQEDSNEQQQVAYLDKKQEDSNEQLEYYEENQEQQFFSEEYVKAKYVESRNSGRDINEENRKVLGNFYALFIREYKNSDINITASTLLFDLVETPHGRGVVIYIDDEKSGVAFYSKEVLNYLKNKK